MLTEAIKFFKNWNVFLEFFLGSTDRFFRLSVYGFGMVHMFVSGFLVFGGGVVYRFISRFLVFGVGMVHRFMSGFWERMCVL